MDQQFSFTALDWYSVGERRCVAVKNTRECQDFEWLVNQRVTVDGSPFVVRGVERFLHCPPWWAGERIGLVVEPIEARP